MAVDLSETTETKEAEVPAEGAITAEDMAKLLKTEREKSEDLDRRFRDAQARASTAERQRDEFAGRAQTEQGSRFVAEESAIASAIAAATAEADKLENEIANLNADGKYVESAKVARKMAQQEARIQQYEARKEWLGQQKQQFEAQQAQRQAEPKQAADPMAAYTPAARQWIEKHPDYLTDDNYKHRVYAAHWAAIRDGHAENSKGYFDVLNAAVEPAGEEEPEAEAAPQPRQRQATVPVARSTPQAASRQSPLKLSPDEREIADASMAWIKDPAERYKEYASMREKLKSEGRI